MRVLFLTHRVPYPPNRGDRIRAYHMVRALSACADVDVVSLAHRAEEAEAATVLSRTLPVRVTPLRVPYFSNRVAAALALPGSRPLTHVLLDSRDAASTLTALVDRRRPDVVLAYCSSMARFALEPPLAGIPLVLDLVDVDSVKWATLATASKLPKSWIYRREARLLSAFERKAMLSAHTTLVVNDREAAEARRVAPTAHVEVLPLGVDVDALTPNAPPGEEPRVVFCGVMNYAPNVDGIVWFARSVWPLVRQMLPTASLTIVGSDPTEQVRGLADAMDGIEVTGRVPEVTAYLWNAAVAVAPMMVARGTQNKVLEAVAAGLPCVVTQAVFEGLPPEVRPACVVADRPEAFAAAVVELLRMGGQRRRGVVASADCRHLSWDERLRGLPAVLERSVRDGATARS